MRVQVRDGYVVNLTRTIDLGNDKIEKQEINFYQGQTADLNEQEVNEHAHKLEPKDKESKALLDGKVLPTTQSGTLGLSAEQLAIVQAMAQAMAQSMVTAMANQAVQAPAPTPAG